MLGHVMCQCDWAQDAQRAANVISGCVCEGVSGKDAHLMQWTERGILLSPVQVGITQPLGGPRENREAEEGDCAALGHQCSSLSGLWTWTRTYTIGCPGSQASRPGLNYLPSPRLSWVTTLQTANHGTGPMPAANSSAYLCPHTVPTANSQPGFP